MQELEASRQERMTRTERMKALATEQRPDRVPIMPLMQGFCAKNVGYTVASLYNDPEKSFWAQVWTQEQYDHDGSPGWGYASYPAWEFGGEVRFPTKEWEQAPSIVRFPAQSEEDVYKLESPDVKTAGSIPLAMEFFKLCEKHNMAISVNAGSPFTWAGNLCGVDKLCRWMVKKPELAHRLLRLATDYALQLVQYYADTFGAKRISASTGMPSDANYVISPKHFQEFALPYLKELHEKILAMGVRRIFCHACGDHNLNLPYLAQVPMGSGGIVSFGHEVDLTIAIKYFGDSCIVAGNVEPQVVQNGTPETVYELTKQCIEKAKYAPHGFILMTGCELPPMAPPYNVYAMKKAVNDFGWYE